MVTTVLFDLDSTLLDSIDALVKSWVRASRKLGVDVDPDMVRNIIGFSRETATLRIFNEPDLIVRVSPFTG